VGRQDLARASHTGPRALEGAVHGLLGRGGHVGNLGGREAEQLPQQEDCDLAAREELQRGQERERDRLGLLDALVRAGRGRARGHRLEPHDLAEFRGFRRQEVGHVPLHLPPTQHRSADVETPVGGHPVEPCPQ